MADIAWEPNSKRFAVSSLGPGVWVVEASEKPTARRIHEGIGQSALAWDADLLVTLTQYFHLRIFKPSVPEHTHDHLLPSVIGDVGAPVTCTADASSRRLLMVNQRDGDVQLLSANPHPVPTARIQDKRIHSAFLLKNRTNILIVTKEGELMTWDQKVLKPYARLPIRPDAVRLSRSGGLMVAREKGRLHLIRAPLALMP